MTARTGCDFWPWGGMGVGFIGHYFFESFTVARGE